MFETGEYVVYGRTGICQVTGVTTMKMDGSSSERLYYILRPGGEKERFLHRWKAGNRFSVESSRKKKQRN